MRYSRADRKNSLPCRQAALEAHREGRGEPELATAFYKCHLLLLAANPNWKRLNGICILGKLWVLKWVSKMVRPR
jgi:hypothetical protein